VSQEMPSGSNNFTDFVLAHSDTLEELDMEYGQELMYALLFDDSCLGFLREDSLPHLRSFRGSASTLTVMIQARMNCLTTTLRKLIVGPGERHWEMSDMRSTCDAIVAFQNRGDSGSAGCFSALRELELDLSYQSVDHDIIECIEDCGQCFGSTLEVMTLSLPMTITAELLSELFGNFDKLRVIRL
jgi:hypothetical protein